MLKKIVTVLLVLIATQSLLHSVYSQSRTIKTPGELAKKLIRVCAVSNNKSSAIYYAEYIIRGDSMVRADYRDIKDTVLQQTLQNYLKQNGSNISWKSILRISGDSLQTFSVIQPFIIIHNYAKDQDNGNYDPLAGLYEALFSRLSVQMGVPFLLPPIHIETSVFECGLPPRDKK
jgi:hypothetical protein